MGTSLDKTTYPLLGCPNPDVELLCMLVQYDGAGVPSIAQGLGVRSITDDGTGLFTIKTNFQWKALIGGAHLGSAASAAGRAAEIVPSSVSATNSQFQVRITNAAGAAADPANGDGMYFIIAFQRAVSAKSTG